jgi:hypothetical protein
MPKATATSFFDCGELLMDYTARADNLVAVPSDLKCLAREEGADDRPHAQRLIVGLEDTYR